MQTSVKWNVIFSAPIQDRYFKILVKMLLTNEPLLYNYYCSSQDKKDNTTFVCGITRSESAQRLEGVGKSCTLLKLFQMRDINIISLGPKQAQLITMHS